MDCIEVRYNKGDLEAIPGAEVEDWSDVQQYVTVADDHGALIGWGRWTRLLEVVDEFGDHRFYMLDEAS